MIFAVLCTPISHGIFHQVAVLFSPNQFLGEVLSSQIEEPQEKTWCTSIAARVLDYIPSTCRPSLAEVLTLATKDQLHITDDNTVLLVYRPHTDITCDARDPPPPPFDPLPRVYVPMLMRPWVLHTCHSTSSCHLGGSRTLTILRRSTGGSAWTFPSVGSSAADPSARCERFRTKTIRWPTLSLPLPNGPGILVSVDDFGPLPLTPRGNAYILLFMDRSSRHADMYALQKPILPPPARPTSLLTDISLSVDAP